MSSTATAFIFLISVKMSSNTGVFRYDSAATCGNPMYYFYLEDKIRCLRACYEESECAVADYRENEGGFCRLHREGDTSVVKGYTLSRGETDSSCKLIEIPDSEVSFQRIPRQEDSSEAECNGMPDVAVLQPYDRVKFRFFVLDSTKVPDNWAASEFRLLFSKKAEESCNSVPVFHKANLRRLYFGEVYNTSGYYFYNAFAFTDYCVSPAGECLGVQEIQEYIDDQGNFFYDEPGRSDMTDSGLGQRFFIAGKRY